MNQGLVPSQASISQPMPSATTKAATSSTPARKAKPTAWDIDPADPGPPLSRFSPERCAAFRRSSSSSRDKECFGSVMAPCRETPFASEAPRPESGATLGRRQVTCPGAPPPAAVGLSSQEALIYVGD